MLTWGQKIVDPLHYPAKVHFLRHPRHWIEAIHCVHLHKFPPHTISVCCGCQGTFSTINVEEFPRNWSFISSLAYQPSYLELLKTEDKKIIWSMICNHSETISSVNLLILSIIMAFPPFGVGEEEEKFPEVCDKCRVIM